MRRWLCGPQLTASFHHPTDGSEVLKRGVVFACCHLPHYTNRVCVCVLCNHSPSSSASPYQKQRNKRSEYQMQSPEIARNSMLNREKPIALTKKKRTHQKICNLTTRKIPSKSPRILTTTTAPAPNTMAVHTFIAMHI